MPTSKTQSILDAVQEAATKHHANVVGSEDGETVSVLVRFEPGNKAQFTDAETAVNNVLALVPMVRDGSVWGNDGGSVGGAVGLEGGYLRLTKSGCDKRVAKGLFAMESQLQFADVWSGASQKSSVSAGTAKRQAKKAKAEVAKAEEFIEAEGTKAKARATKAPACTEEQIVNERDGKGLSWKQVAINLDLGSPGAARRMYTQLTGRHHSESQMTGKRAARGSASTGRKLTNPEWNDDSDQDEITDKLQGVWVEPIGEVGSKNYVPGHYSGSRIVVTRKLRGSEETYDEELRVARVVSFTFGKDGDQPLQVTVIDEYSGAQRCFFVTDITSVQ
jgi:hypothetical protein